MLVDGRVRVMVGADDQRPDDLSRTRPRARSRLVAAVTYVAFSVGALVFGLMYVSFLRWGSQRARTHGVDGWVIVFTGLSPVEVAFVLGGALASRIHGQARFAVTWCVVLLAGFLAVNGAIWLYYDIGSCLVTC